ncbi:hypothetical protein DUNSADRAFT_14267 [Dunaliella salina]|uniref:Uncharacterized protein n=1 Tax=Dunaliella salina TaxID=3046 RepID=A0ABQ7G7N1_DUNSA|nr:hypothetical protein DUNSADRAFT_14267 [Dunaliella salina]|eukprot:KAF5830601.1 hypothetical protein DUNSADRAFT_14267 [Dunaliella salina]
MAPPQDESPHHDEFFQSEGDDPTLHFYDSDDNLGDTNENAAPNASEPTHTEPTWNEFSPITSVMAGMPTTKDVSFFISRLDDEAYEGAGQSLRQWLYARVAEKLEHTITNSLFERQLLREYHGLILFQKKQSVIIPTSLHLLRRILGVKELWEVEYHICPCESHFWSPIPPKDWHHPASSLSWAILRVPCV